MDDILVREQRRCAAVSILMALIAVAFLFLMGNIMVQSTQSYQESTTKNAMASY